MQSAFAKNQGFTMVELAITLTILSIVAATIMMDTLMGASIRAQDITVQRMNAVQDALKLYYRLFYRVPCPAPGQVTVNTTSYGAADSVLGATGATNSCTDATNPMFGPTNNVMMGAVPTKTLALPDEYGLDGFGHKIMYVIDIRYAQDLTTHPLPMAIKVYDPTISIVTTRSLNAALLFSCGKFGNGAFPATGSTIAARISSLTANTNEDQNITSTSFNEIFYQKPFNPDDTTTNRFDQIVMPVAFDVIH